MLFGVDFAAASGLPAQPSVLRTPFADERTSGLHDHAYNGSCLHLGRRTRLHFYSRWEKDARHVSCGCAAAKNIEKPPLYRERRCIFFSNIPYNI